VAVQADFTGEERDGPPHIPPLPPGVEAGDRGIASRRINQAHEQPDERRLARAVRAQEPQDFALCHFKRDVRQGGEPAVSLREPLRRYDRLGHQFAPTSAIRAT
jgi:hypothetical protein